MTNPEVFHSNLAQEELYEALSAKGRHTYRNLCNAVVIATNEQLSLDRRDQARERALRAVRRLNPYEGDIIYLAHTGNNYNVFLDELMKKRPKAPETPEAIRLEDFRKIHGILNE